MKAQGFWKLPASTKPFQGQGPGKRSADERIATANFQAQSYSRSQKVGI